ncbi:MAG: ABC transporter ATP-binding protein [Candidatus Heimdallarchaeota archaeon]|nr:ABC transporter ATP-binding protein [Candidatus Heimdallarchaeota archaeon]
MIITRELSKQFVSDSRSVDAVQNLNLNIAPGAVVGLLGPNGAGKTTTIRLLSTVYRPTTGGAIVADYDIISDPLNVRKSIGIATETPTLYPRLTAERNLRYFADLYDVNKSSRDELIVDLLTKFGLKDVMHQRIETFSKGMKQKMSLIKAILHDPKVLFLDEPWSGLSPEATRDLRHFITQLAEDKERTIMISTHNLVQAEMIVDQLVVIAGGKLIVDSTPEKLRDRYSVKPIVQLKLDDYSNIMDILSPLDFVLDDVEIEDNLIYIHINSFERTPDLITHLVNNKQRIHSVKEVIPSLEDIYLKLIEEGAA